MTLSATSSVISSGSNTNEKERWNSTGRPNTTKWFVGCGWIVMSRSRNSIETLIRESFFFVLFRVRTCIYVGHIVYSLVAMMLAHADEGFDQKSRVMDWRKKNCWQTEVLVNFVSGSLSLKSLEVLYFVLLRCFVRLPTCRALNRCWAHIRIFFAML
jgi:hypothetical protein